MSIAELPLSIQLALVISVIALTVIMIAYLGILLLRWSGYRNDIMEERLLPEIRKLVVEHIIMNEQLATVAVEKIRLPLASFRSLGLNKKAVRRLLTGEILHYRQNFAGKVRPLLKKLYIDLLLHHDAERKLGRNKIQAIVTALNELQQMNIPVNEQRVFPLLNHRNRYVREAARCYYVKLSADEPFRFLDTVKDPILPWEQFELFRIISQRNDVSLPEFSKWIKPESHSSVISFCLKLTVHFQQHEAIPAIIQLLSVRDEKLRAELINALGKLMAEEAELPLLELYKSQPAECRLEILKALGRIGSGNHLDFLRQQFEVAETVELRKHAARSIVNHQVLSAGLLEELKKSSSGLDRTILQHAMNPLIKY